MANIIPLKDNTGAQFYPQTHEKAVVDSNGVNLQTKLASITTPTYVTAWDGDSTPVVANIPSGVTVTYGGTTYTGTLAASASTANKTYLVGTGTTDNYNRYVTQLNGSTYSWQNIGSTEIDLSDYATKEELGQLDQKVAEKKFSVITGKYIKPDGTIGKSSQGFYTNPIPVKAGETLTYSIQGAGCAILSTFNSGVVTPVVVAPSPNTTYTNQTYTALADGYVVFCGKQNTLKLYSSISRLDWAGEVEGLEQVVNRGIEKYETRVEIEGITTGGINTSGTVVAASTFRYTNPVYFAVGGTVRVNYSGAGISVVSLTDKQGTSYAPIYIDDGDDATTSKEIYTTIPGNSYIAFCYRTGYVFTVNFYADVARAIDKKVDAQVGQSNKVIDAELNIVSYNHYNVYSPFQIKKGEAILVHTKGGLFTVIAESNSNGDLISRLVYSYSGSSSVFNDYAYIAERDMNVVVCGDDSIGFYIRIGVIYAVQDINKRLNELTGDVRTLEERENTVVQQVELGSLNNGVIDVSGNIISSNNYTYSNPIYFSENSHISITYSGDDFSPVSVTDAQGTTHTPLLTDNSGDSESSKTSELHIPANTYVCFCGRKYHSFFVNKFANLTRIIDSNIPYIIEESNKLIDNKLNIITAEDYFYTKPIAINKGETVCFHTRGGLMTAIASSDNAGNLIAPLVYSDKVSGQTFSDYFYCAPQNMYIVVCGKYTLGAVVKVGLNSAVLSNKEITDKIEKFHSGIYIYPFRAIVGKRVIIYKDSIASGLKPSQVYQVDCASGDNMQNYTWNAISLLPSAVGEQNVNVRVSDIFNGKRTKTIKVTSAAMPNSKLQNSSPIDVFWMGDSLIGFNGNLIGAEWFRMLATNDQETHTDPITKAVQLPTYNICPGKINLVGENYWNARYMYVYSLRVLMTGKRDVPYDPNIGHAMVTNRNPWYNPDSTEPDEIGEDGFNKRVDLPWYFNNACGVGRYPKLFYLAIGVNDVASQGWGYETVEGVTENFVLLCKKIKSECDKIAGGDSGIKIKVLNHQTYPLHNMYYYECDTLQQRLVWNLLYDSYFDAINDEDNGISNYVELIDCASRFDWRVGYTQEDIATNPRYNGNQDIFIEECVHMNNVGAFNYADALIDDFLADSDFD